MLKKIAHNSTIPSLAGNSEIRPLQDLILAEKAVLVSLQRLSADTAKASDTLRLWALSEGDDLFDNLGVSSTLLNHFSSALSRYSSHVYDIRDQLKEIRTREEALDDMKRRRRSLLAKADSADKKLNKMSPEHKNLAMQTDLLNKLTDDIKIVDKEIMVEETSLADFKRTTARTSMALKFGGILECCEKGIVVGEIGKLVVSEIPDDVTPPGAQRRIYEGHARVESLAAEAQRRIDAIKFSAVLSSPTVPRGKASAKLVVSAGNNYGSPPDQSPTHGGMSPNYLGSIQGLDRGHFLDPIDAPTLGLTDIVSYPNAGRPTDSPPLPQKSTSAMQRSVDDFGVTNAPASSAGGGRFVTFPVKGNRALPLGSGIPRDERRPPMLGYLESRHGQSESLSTSIAAAMGNDNPFLSDVRPRRSLDSETNPLAYVPPLRRLPGDPWKDDTNERSSQEEPQLAYTMGTPETFQPSEQPVSQGGDDRYVRFGSFSHVDEESENDNKDIDGQKTHRDDIGMSGRMTGKEEQFGQLDDRAQTITHWQTTAPLRLASSKKEEQELNAAAARQISRELDALHSNPPSPVTSTHTGGQEASPYRGVSPTLHSPLNTSPRRQTNFESSSNVQTPVSPTQSHVSLSYGSAQGESSPTVPRSPITPPSPKFSIPTVIPPINLSTLEIQPPSPATINTPQQYGAGMSKFTPTFTGNKSTSSLPSSPAPTGARTITAAAFKRSQQRVMSGPGVGPAGIGTGAAPQLVRKRTLPSSPYPLHHQHKSAGNTGPVNARTDDMGMPRMRSDTYSRLQQQLTYGSVDPPSGYPQQQQQQQPPAPPPYGNAGHPNSEGSQFDPAMYTSVESGTMDQGAHGVGDHGPRTAGYGEGRFATDLEDGGLR